MPATTPRAYQIGDIDWKQSVRAVATVPQNLATRAVDGVVLNDGDRALLVGQGSNSQVASINNGIYQWSNAQASLIRSIDASQPGAVSAGMTVTVTEGQTNADTTWVLTTDDPILLGVTSLTFQQTGAAAIGAQGAIQFSTGPATGFKLNSSPNLVFDAGNANLNVAGNLNVTVGGIYGNITGNISGNSTGGNGNFGGTFRGNVVASNLIPSNTSITLGSPSLPWSTIYSQTSVQVGGPQGAAFQSLSAGTASFRDPNSGNPAGLFAGDTQLTSLTAGPITSNSIITTPILVASNYVTTPRVDTDFVDTTGANITTANISQLNYANGDPRIYVTEIQTGTGLQGGPIQTVGTISLATSGVTPGTYGTATQVGRVTFDQYGRATTVSNVTITPAFSSVTGKPTTLAGYGITDAVNLSQLGIATTGGTTGVATLDSLGRVPSTQLPPLVISQTYVVANVSDITSLPANVGDIAVVSANSSTFILQYAPPTIFSNWVQLLFPAAVVSVNGKTGAVALDYNDVGAVSNVRTITAANGLTGGGTLTSNVTIALANTTVTPGVYGDASNIPQITIDSTGRITTAATVPVDPTSSIVYAIALG